MKRLILLICITGLCLCVTAQTGKPKKDRERKRMAEITSVISISDMQRKGIHDALSRKRARAEAMDTALTARETAFRKYAIEKECHEEFIRQLSDRQIADYCNTVFAPEVEAKTEYRLSLLREVDNDYTEEELAAAREKIYRYLMLEKIVYFKYKYDFAKQKENISRLKALQPATLKASLNNEKQKGYGKVMSGHVSWHKGKKGHSHGRNGR